jgi:demethylmenaquinone methyltransferase/2-methoxy-6-polyprenyl-1,4-benzoquinol methylase
MKTNLNFEEHNKEIRSIFSRIAQKYDFINQIISLGQANSWREQAIHELKIGKNDKILDLASGTGDLALSIKNRLPESFVVGIDLTPEMLQLARKRDTKNCIHWVIADALHLPFKDETFHKIISAYLLRNAADLPTCLEEQYRVTIPSGRMVALDTTPPKKSWLSPLVKVYIKFILPFFGSILANDFQAYNYLSYSTQNFFLPEEIINQSSKAKFTNPKVKLKMFSTIFILSADKE